MGCRKTVMFARTGTTFLLCFFSSKYTSDNYSILIYWSWLFSDRNWSGIYMLHSLGWFFFAVRAFCSEFEEAFGKDYTAWLSTTWSVSKKYQCVCLMTKVKSNITFVSQAFNWHVLFFLLGDSHFKTTSRKMACDEDRIFIQKVHLNAQLFW